MTEFFNHLIHEVKLPLSNPVLVFSVILFIILLSPIILRKLNIPGIIVLIISGVIVGPNGLNILEKNEAIDLFSTIGLLYIMFIAGLEMDMNELKANRNKSLLFGFFTFIIPLGIGFPVCYYFLGYEMNASLLISSMFATHTLVTYPIISRFRISRNQAVVTTVGGTILTDTAVLILLAIIITNSQGNLNQHFWIRLGIWLTIFAFIMFVIIPRVVKWFFRKLESETHSHYIFVLSIVFFAAFLAEVAGIEPIIGAFVAGLALNRLIPSTSALMNRIAFIGNALFIPFFLLSVGMLVDVTVIFKGPQALIVAATLSIVALLGKWIAAFLTQVIFRYTKAQRQLIFGLSSSHAVATLAVILIGYNEGILDENILNGTIILILVTCMVASFAAENAAKKIVLAERNKTSGIEKAKIPVNEHILLPIANIDNIGKLLEFSIYIKDRNSPNPVSILSVVSNNEEAEINILRAKKRLEEFVKQASASETKVNVLTTIDHNPASGISRVSREIMSDIIVLGWPKKTGFIDKLIGEKVDNILHNTDKVIFICQIDKPLIVHKKILTLIPPLAERENNFEIWYNKITKLGHELSIPVLFHCSPVTGKSIKGLIKKDKLTSSNTIQLYYDRRDFLEISKHIMGDDIIILISARKGSASYTGSLENLPGRLEKQFVENNRIIIYP